MEGSTVFPTSPGAGESDGEMTGIVVMMTVVVVKSCFTAACHVIGHLRTSVIVTHVSKVSIKMLLCVEILRGMLLSTVSRLVPLISNLRFCLNMEVEGLLLAVVAGTVLLVGGALVTWSSPEVLHRGGPTVNCTAGDSYAGIRAVRDRSHFSSALKWNLYG